MEIIKYDDKYRDDVHALTKEFHQESLDEYGMAFDHEALNKTIEEIKDQSYLLIMDGKAVGMLAGKEVQTPTSSERYWHEMAWFVTKDHRRYGIKLLQDVKKLLKEEGFDAIVMICMHNSKTVELDDLYKKLGMQPLETHYIGRLK